MRKGGREGSLVRESGRTGSGCGLLADGSVDSFAGDV